MVSEQIMLNLPFNNDWILAIAYLCANEKSRLCRVWYTRTPDTLIIISAKLVHIGAYTSASATTTACHNFFNSRLFSTLLTPFKLNFSVFICFWILMNLKSYFCRTRPGYKTTCIKVHAPLLLAKKYFYMLTQACILNPAAGWT